ncbi:hypothetical protein CkaCkLH20_04561 [Colletotrichum karsti]|uniref:Cell wall protein n=1 Tax=Colletotrichum karsti TaxID=1095194 RepID=A0A9P6I8N7_9PEZI|nr:uncharacterized protein CkaCkLH20_04561 [Colletotrichum karsti]KAF9877985.1 hypothetical protein CkaCkLH20_04561 [Colletotrichum karsti]
MQSKIFSAAVAALALTSSVNAAAVDTRQNNVIVIQPASIVGPTIAFDPSALGLEALVYRALDQLRDDITRTSALITELNKAFYANLDAKKAQADAVVKQVQENANNIRIKLESLTGTIQGKIDALPKQIPAAPTAPTLPAVPTLPTGGSGGGSGGGGAGGAGGPGAAVTSVVNGVTTIIGGIPTAVAGGIVSTAVANAGGAANSAAGAAGAAASSAVAAGGAAGSAAAGAAQGAAGTAVAAAGGAVNTVVAEVPGAVSTAIGTVGGIVDRVDAVLAAARTLNSQARSQINQVGSYLETLITPTIGQIKTESAKSIANSFKQISTATDTFFVVVLAAAENGQGTSAVLIQRITAAKVSLNPTFILGISPDVTF